MIKKILWITVICHDNCKSPNKENNMSFEVTENFGYILKINFLSINSLQFYSMQQLIPFWKLIVSLDA